MTPYTCTECDWEYDVLAMGDRVKAVTRHQLTHLLEKYRSRSDGDDDADFARRTVETRRSLSSTGSERTPVLATGRRGSDDRLRA